MATTTTERRRAPRYLTIVLVSIRRMQEDQVIWSGFARSLNLSASGALIETPDQFKVGEHLSFEFLLDNHKIAAVDGGVMRITKSKGMKNLAIQFDPVPPKTKRLLAKQAKSTSEPEVRTPDRNKKRKS